MYIFFGLNIIFLWDMFVINVRRKVQYLYKLNFSIVIVEEKYNLFFILFFVFFFYIIIVRLYFN